MPGILNTKGIGNLRELFFDSSIDRHRGFSIILLRTGLLQISRNWDRAEITLENPALEHPVDTTVIRAPVHNSRSYARAHAIFCVLSLEF